MAWYDEFFMSSEEKARRSADQRLRDTLDTLGAFNDAAARYPARRIDNSGLAMQLREQQARAAAQQHAVTAQAAAEEWRQWEATSGYLPHEAKAATDKLLHRVAVQYKHERTPTELALDHRHLEMAKDAAAVPALAREIKRLRTKLEREGAEAQQRTAEREALEEATGADAAADAAMRIIARRKSGKRVAVADTDPRLETTQQRLFRQQGII